MTIFLYILTGLGSLLMACFIWSNIEFQVETKRQKRCSKMKNEPQKPCSITHTDTPHFRRIHPATVRWIANAMVNHYDNFYDTGFKYDENIIVFTAAEWLEYVKIREDVE